MTFCVPWEPVRTVIVPVDGSRLSSLALLEASDLALRLGAAVHLLTAVPREADIPEQEAALREIEVVAPEIRREVVIDLDPAGAIHEALRRLHPAVVCMASRGRGRAAGLVGSVASAVIARGHDSLILVGQFLDERLPGYGVIACVDETPASQAIIPVALGWAELLHEPLTVVTVAEPAPDPLRGPVRRAFGPYGDVDAFLERIVAPLRDTGHQVRARPVYDPISPADGICSLVEDHPASLVGLCSHGRLGTSRLVHGSVAATVVHRSTVPVVVTPRTDGTQRR
jgi:nucleotide-binding universal stress UspA family protein